LRKKTTKYLLVFLLSENIFCLAPMADLFIYRDYKQVKNK